MLLDVFSRESKRRKWSDEDCPGRSQVDFHTCQLESKKNCMLRLCSLSCCQLLFMKLQTICPPPSPPPNTTANPYSPLSYFSQLLHSDLYIISSRLPLIINNFNFYVRMSLYHFCFIYFPFHRPPHSPTQLSDGTASGIGTVARPCTCFAMESNNTWKL